MELGAKLATYIEIWFKHSLYDGINMKKRPYTTAPLIMANIQLTSIAVFNIHIQFEYHDHNIQHLHL